MSKKTVRKKLWTHESTRRIPNRILKKAFYCPACQTEHLITVKAPRNYQEPVWNWNHKEELVTITPSLVFESPTGKRCHSFITLGRIHYMSDSEHELRGSAVNMVEKEVEWT